MYGARSKGGNSNICLGTSFSSRVSSMVLPMDQRPDRREPCCHHELLRNVLEYRKNGMI